MCGSIKIHPWMNLKTKQNKDIWRTDSHPSPGEIGCHRLRASIYRMFELTASIEIKWKMFHVYKSMSIDIVQLTWYKRRKRTKHTCIMTFLFYSFAYLNYFTQHVSVIGGLIYFALLCFTKRCCSLCVCLSFSLCHHCQQQKSRKMVFRCSCSLPFFRLQMYDKYVHSQHL